MAAPVNKSGEPELRPSDLPDTASLKAVDVCDAVLPDKSPSEGEALVPPLCAGAFFVICSVHVCGFCIG